MADGRAIVARSNVVAERNNIGRFISKMEAAATRTVEETIREGAHASTALAPIGKKPNRHGIKLKNSIETRMINATQGEWYSTAPHALHVEFGTEPHMIFGKLGFFWDKAGRRWVWNHPAFGPDGSRPGFTNWNPAQGSRVSHPGTQAQPFLRPAYEAVVRRQMMQIAKRNYG